MGILIRQSIHSTFFVYLGAVIGFVNTTILYPKFLTESQIGVLNLIVAYAIIFGFLGTFGFTKAIGKFFPFFRSVKEKNRGFVFLTLMVGLVGFLVFILIFIPIKDLLTIRNIDKSPLFAKYISLIIPLTFIHIYWNLLDTYNTMLYRTTFGILVKEFWLRLLFTLGIAFLIFNYIDFQEFIYFYVTSFGLILLMLIIHLIYHKDFNILPRFNEYKPSLMRGMTSWSAFGFLTGLGGFAALKIDSLMINEFIDSAATGIYVTVSNFATLIYMPSRGMYRIASTIISDSFKDNDFKKLKDIYTRSCLTQTIIALYIFIGLVVNIDNIFRILPEQYIAAFWVVVIFGVANVIRMFSGVSEFIIALSSYYKYQSLFIIIYLAAIVGTNYIFIPIYGINGAAMASAISIFLYFLIKFLFIYMKFKFQPYNYRYILLFLLSGIIIYVLGFLPYFDNLFVDIFIRGILVTIIFVGSIYFFKFSDDVNTVINNSIQFLMTKLKK